MILTALKGYIHELAGYDKKKAKVIGVIQIKNFQDKIFLVLDDETIREFEWDKDETLPIQDLVKLYLNKNMLEIEFKESKDKD
jgi:hypothetical protein|nr:MAG TPA: hypothetical protein [Caudoviricetes sp.]